METNEKSAPVQAVDQSELLQELQSVKDERETMINAFVAIRKEFEDREWIMEGRGEYLHNDDGYRREVRYIMDAFSKIEKDMWEQIKSKTHEYRNEIEKPLLSKISELTASLRPAHDETEPPELSLSATDVWHSADLQKTLDGLINKFLRKEDYEWNNGDITLYPSVQHYFETGKVSGGLRFAIHNIAKAYAQYYTSKTAAISQDETGREVTDEMIEHMTESYMPEIIQEKAERRNAYRDGLIAMRSKLSEAGNSKQENK